MTGGVQTRHEPPDELQVGQRLHSIRLDEQDEHAAQEDPGDATQASGASTTKVCATCQLTDKERYITTTCGHDFHETCFIVQYTHLINTRGNLDQLRCTYATDSGDEPCGIELTKEWLSSIGLTKEHRGRLGKIMNEVYLRSIRTMDCPQCRTPCQRARATDQRVRCRPCYSIAKEDFCFFCGLTWKTSSKTNCGNRQCSGKDPLLHLVETCPEVSIRVGLVETVEAPQCRLCPHCGILIERGGGCKSVMCPTCVKGFCFLCLDKFNSPNGLKCSVPPKIDKHYARCTKAVAPRQKRIPSSA